MPVAQSDGGQADKGEGEAPNTGEKYPHSLIARYSDAGWDRSGPPMLLIQCSDYLHGELRIRSAGCLPQEYSYLQH